MAPSLPWLNGNPPPGIFTIVRQPEMSAEQLVEDARTGLKDLTTLKRLIEAEPATASDESAVHAHHAIDYIELAVTDVAATKRFYAAGGPLVVLYSRSLDGTLEAVRKGGGKVVKELFDFPGGRRFHFTDPSGNELAVWSSR